jgi:ABC-type branched-subunit amino acid transport system substrate-binding protein
VRVATTDDLQGPAVAVYAKANGAEKIYILDSQDAYGKGVADAFEAQYQHYFWLYSCFYLQDYLLDQNQL